MEWVEVGGIQMNLASNKLEGSCLSVPSTLFVISQLAVESGSFPAD